MAGEQQAGRVPGFGSEAHTAGHEGCLHLDLAESGYKRPALQPFFQRPGGILRMTGLDDEKEGRVEAETHEPGSVRAPPFARGALRQTPQHEPWCCIPPHQAPANGGKGEGQGRRGIAVGGRFDLVQTASLELAEGWLSLLPPFVTLPES
jgi:hypothetical protein